MYVVERLEGESTRHVLTAPDHESVQNLLQMIARSRSRAAKPVEAEHLRAAAYRLSTGSHFNDLLTLAGERFRIREDANVPAASKPTTRSLRKLVRGLPPLSTILDQRTSVQAAVKVARSESEPEPGWIPMPTEDPVQIHGERFEI